MVGNIGDSRAVLATRDEDNALLAVQLTVDLKPDLPGTSSQNLILNSEKPKQKFLNFLFLCTVR